jgi:citrate lyase beta subunit
MRTFLFLAVRAPEFTARLVRAANHSRATVILDLEDALWDVTDPARTAALKATGRESLVALARDHAELFTSGSIGVRVNRVAGDEADLDFEAVSRVAANVPLAFVVVPKVEGPADVHAARRRIAGLGLAPRALVPIVESRAAIADLDAILDAARAASVAWIVFGLYDLALDSGWWPFPDHRGPAHWALVRQVRDRVEAAGINYIDPPYANVDDDAGLARILARLERTCRREFGALTVGLGQARAASRFAAGREHASPADAGTDGLSGDEAGSFEIDVDPLEAASRVVEVYDARDRADTSFTVDPATGRFIPPHAYLAATRYLREHAVPSVPDRA